MHCDLDNSTIVIQEKAIYHQFNKQATIHPFIIYFIGKQKTEYLTHIIISDCLIQHSCHLNSPKKHQFCNNKILESFQKFFIFLISPLSIQKLTNSPTCDLIRKTSTLRQNDIQPYHMGKDPYIVGINSDFQLGRSMQSELLHGDHFSQALIN